MSRSPVLVRLRYRPCADVLSGEVVAPASPTVPAGGVPTCAGMAWHTERPHEDCVITWESHGPAARLVSFHHLAPRRVADGLDAHVPPALHPPVGDLVRAGAAALAAECSLAARITLVTEALVQVAHGNLLRGPTQV